MLLLSKEMRSSRAADQRKSCFAVRKYTTALKIRDDIIVRGDECIPSAAENCSQLDEICFSLHEISFA